MKRHYEDMYDMPRHQSKKHPAMPMRDRAAQFSPFSALTGYHEAVEETGRLTERKRELDEDEILERNNRLVALSRQSESRPEATITYFVPDERKEGGAYRTVTGRIKKIDRYRQMVALTDGTEIPVDDISSIQCGTGEGEEVP